MSHRMKILGTPWTSHDELVKMHDNLYKITKPREDEESTDLFTQRLIAVNDTLLSWRLRGGNPKYSSEIQTTQCFTAALIHDHLITVMEESSREEEGSYTASVHLQAALPSLYGTAIVGFNDLMRNFTRKANGQVVRSVSKAVGSITTGLAESLGLPGWITDIRNDWAHGVHPSLPVLRKTAHIGLNFLTIHFWTPLVQSQDVHLAADAVVDNILVSRDKSVVKRKIDKFLFRGEAKLINLNFMVESLLRKTKWSHKKKVTGVEHVKQIDEEHLRVRSVIIEQTCRRQLLHIFCHHLISFFDSEEDHMREASIAWFVEIMRGITSADSSMFNVLSKISVESNCHRRIHWTKVLHHLARKPSRITIHILPYFSIILPHLEASVVEMREKMEILVGNELVVDTSLDETSDSRQSQWKKRRRSKQTSGKAKRKKPTEESWVAKTVDDLKRNIQHQEDTLDTSA